MYITLGKELLPVNIQNIVDEIRCKEHVSFGYTVGPPLSEHHCASPIAKVFR